jgi:ABC-2 type transport system permease protein
VHSLKAGFINELFLMAYRKKTVLFLIVSAILPILFAVSLHSLQPLLGLIAVSQSFPVDMLGIYTLLWIPLFILLTVSDLFPGEIAARTLKLALLRPISRFQVFLSKTAALAAGIGVILLLLFVSASVCTLFMGAQTAVSDWAGIVKAYLAASVSMLTLAVVFVFAAQFFKSASGFFAFSIVLYLAAKIAPFFVRAVSAFSPASYTNWHTLWLSGTVSAGTLLQASLFLISSCILFFSLGYLMFYRKEV